MKFTSKLKLETEYQIVLPIRKGISKSYTKFGKGGTVNFQEIKLAPIIMWTPLFCLFYLNVGRKRNIANSYCFAIADTFMIRIQCIITT